MFPINDIHFPSRRRERRRNPIRDQVPPERPYGLDEAILDHQLRFTK